MSRTAFQTNVSLLAAAETNGRTPLKTVRVTREFWFPKFPRRLLAWEESTRAAETGIDASLPPSGAIIISVGLALEQVGGSVIDLDGLLCVGTGFAGCDGRSPF